MLDSYESKKNTVIASIICGVLGTAGVLFYHYGDCKNLAKMLKGDLSARPNRDNYGLNEITTKILVASVYGLLSAGLGILLSPKSGRYLRQDIVETFNEVKDKSQELVQDAGRQSEKVFVGLSSQANDLVNQAKKVINKFSIAQPEKKSKSKGRARARQEKFPGKLTQVLDLLSLGASVWNSLSQRKKDVTYRQ